MFLTPDRQLLVRKDPKAAGIVHTRQFQGAIAQLVERLNRTQEVSGSTPLSSTSSPYHVHLVALACSSSTTCAGCVLLPFFRYSGSGNHLIQTGAEG